MKTSRKQQRCNKSDRFAKRHKRLSSRRALNFECLENRLLLHSGDLVEPHDHDPTYDPNSSFHIHVDLQVITDGEEMTLPQGLGNSLGASLHTHDDSGRFHVHPQTPPGRFLTVDDLFETWRTDTDLGDPNANFDSTQIFGNVVDDQHILKMFVNGIESDDFENYEFHDEDNITIVYTSNPVVVVKTNVGNFVMELLRGDAPNTVENFLNYTNDGDYINTIFHRSASNFVIQAGGFTSAEEVFTSSSQFVSVPTDPPVQNEFNVSNTLATVAVAKLGSGPSTGTSQWFINLGDNSQNLDNQNGGFTVFARVLDMQVPNEIAALSTVNAGSPFDTLPLTDDNRVVRIESIMGEGTLSGTVFLDENANTTQEAGENGIANVVVFIDENDDGDHDAGEPSTMTDSEGNYFFRLMAGTYIVRHEVPPELTQISPDSPNSHTVVVLIGGDVTDFDFADVDVDDVGFDPLDDSFEVNEDTTGFVINVLDNDVPDGVPIGDLTLEDVGTPDNGGDAEISGSTIVYSPKKDFFGTERFTYDVSFEGMTRQVNVVVNVLPQNDDPTAVNDNFDVTTGSSANVLDVLDNDSIAPDTGETLTIVDLDLTGTQGTVQIIDTNDGQRIDYTPPTNGLIGTDSFNYTIDDGNGGEDTATVVITERDFTLSSLSGFAYFDANGDGLRNGSDVPLGNVVVTLTGTDMFGASVNSEQHTMADGSYSFTDLAPGTYSITQTQPELLLDGDDTIGTQGGQVFDDRFEIELAENTNGTDNNFGEKGRICSIISLQDFLGSSPRNSVFSAITGDDGDGWYAHTDTNSNVQSAEFHLEDNDSVLEVTVTDHDSSQITTQLPTSDPTRVQFLGEDDDTRVYRIVGNLSNLDAAPSTAESDNDDDTLEGEAEPETLHAEGEPPEFSVPAIFVMPETGIKETELFQQFVSSDDDIIDEAKQPIISELASSRQQVVHSHPAASDHALHSLEFEAAVDQLFADDHLLEDLII